MTGGRSSGSRIVDLTPRGPGSAPGKLHQFTYRYRFALHGFKPGKIQQVGDDLLGVVHLLLDHGVVFSYFIFRLGLDELKIVNGVGNDAQRVAQFVSHAPCQLTQHRQFLLAHDFVLCLA